MRSCPDLERSAPRPPKTTFMVSHRRPVVIGTTKGWPRRDDLPCRPSRLRNLAALVFRSRRVFCTLPFQQAQSVLLLAGCFLGEHPQNFFFGCSLESVRLARFSPQASASPPFAQSWSVQSHHAFVTDCPFVFTKEIIGISMILSYKKSNSENWLYEVYYMPKTLSIE